jgi:hypothetical protein
LQKIFCRFITSKSNNKSKKMWQAKRNFPALSYFEWFDADRGIFVSLFKTDKTTFYQKTMPKSGELAFDLSPKLEHNTYLAENILALVDNNFGFSDFFWFMKKQESYSLEEIVHWMRSLYFFNTEEECTDHYGVATLKSNIDPNFALKVYVKSQPLPQEAIDVIPIFTDQTTKEQFVVLATKRKSNPVRVTLKPSLEVDVLSVGKFGKTLLGEHLEEGEKKRMSEIRREFEASGFKPVQMKKKDISSVVRTCFEEGGFTLSADACDILYVHKDDAPARDDRYWSYSRKSGGLVFGYTRDSVSDTVVVMMKGSVPEKLPEPNDFIECETPVIMKVYDVFRLLEKKKISFAFPAHMAQLSIAEYSIAVHTLLNGDDPDSLLGKKAVDINFFHSLGNSLRIILVDGKPVRRNFDLNRQRMNVSISSTGNVNHIFGYF